MLTVTDQMGAAIQLVNKPKRIISLVPSQSEFLWDLGLKKELVGITKFCIHPSEMFQTIERVGGTKELKLDKIRELQPDLIIGNKEENEINQIKELQKEFPVWMSDIYSFDDAFSMMSSLGTLLDKEIEAKQLLDKLKASVERIRNFFPKQRVAYFIWNKPYMLVAGHTFIDHVLTYIGFENALSDLSRYPELSPEQLSILNPDLCLLSSEPFPFKQSHVQELQKILPNAKIMIVDGEVFSWYGSRLLKLERYLASLPLRHRRH